MNFENEKAHNWKKNRRVIIPENDDEENEIKYDFIKKELVKETEKYIQEYWDTLNSSSPLTIKFF